MADYSEESPEAVNLAVSRFCNGNKSSVNKGLTNKKQMKGYQTLFMFLEIWQRTKPLADNVRLGIYKSWFLTIIDESNFIFYPLKVTSNLSYKVAKYRALKGISSHFLSLKLISHHNYGTAFNRMKQIAK